MLSGLCAVFLVVLLPAPGQAVRVDFPGGDRLTGKVVSASNDSVVIEHAVLGKVTVPAASVHPLQKGDSSPVAGESPPQDKTASDTSKALPKQVTPPPNPWKASVSLAATASKTTTSTYNIRLGAEAHHKTDASQFDVTASWYWNQAKGSTTDNDILVRGSQDWFIPDSRWLYFAQGTWQYDQFEAWAHRVSPYGGIGYRLFDQDDLTLTAKGGAGITWQYRGNRVDPQLLGELSTNWKIDSRQTLTGFVSIAPDPVDFGNFLLTLTADWKMKVGEDSPWSFNLGLRNIYDSSPTGDSTSNDLKAYAGLSMDF